MSQSKAYKIAEKLKAQALWVAPALLPHGRRAGNYWKAGDVNGNPGGSLYLNLATGRWRDAATDEYGDLLDLIAVQNEATMAQAMEIANAMLGGKGYTPTHTASVVPIKLRSKDDSIKAVKGLWGRAMPIANDNAAHGRAYLAHRAIPERIITSVHDLRYIKSAWVMIDGVRHTKPALIAAMRNVDDELTGLQRTFLDARQPSKAPMEDARRGLGILKGSACWLKAVGPCLIIGEGLETTLSALAAYPRAACAAAISSQHLQLVNIPARYQNILIAVDRDKAGIHAAEELAKRLKGEGRQVGRILPLRGDFNDDLVADGVRGVRRKILEQMRQAKGEK